MTKNGFALSAGGAQGAYQAGVLNYLFEEVGKEVTITGDVFTGTSAGSLNASMMACFAHDPVEGSRAAIRAWISLDSKLLKMRGILDGIGSGLDGCPAPFSVFDAKPMREKLAEVIPLHLVQGQLDSGALTGVGVVTTHVETGKEVAFVASKQDVSGCPNFVQVENFNGPYTAASISIPLAFQPKKIGNDYFWDGGTRTMMPAWTAYDLGADRILAISTQQDKSIAHNPMDKCEQSATTLANRLMRSLFLDRADADLHRMSNMARPAKTMLIRPSKDLNAISKKYKGAAIKPTNFALWLISQISDEGYALIIHPDLARELVELGRADARAKHAELVEFFSV